MDGRARALPAPPAQGTSRDALFEAIPDAVLHARLPDGRILDANGAFLRLFGLARDEALGGTMEALHADREQFLRHARMLEASAARGETLSAAWPLRRKDGVVFPARVTAAPVGPREDGTVRVLAVVREAPPREAEPSAERADGREERWRDLVNHAPVQILTIDAAGRILTLNRSVRGVPAERLLGVRVYDLVAPKDRERVRAVIEQVIETEAPAEYEADAPVGGVERCFHVRVAPLAQPREKGAVLIVTDVTDRKRAEAEMARMRAQLIQGEKLAALGSLVSGVAHELRTPLTFLANNAFLARQRLLRAAERGAAAREALDEVAPFLAEVVAGVDRINQLVEDLRRYTKARQDPEATTAPLGAMVADAVELFRATNRSRHPIETSLSATSPVRGNKGALQQLVLNLLQNAADASPPGAPLRVVTREAPDGPTLEVVDRGAGIPEAVAARMYEPLFTTKASGTGLGLSIVKRIVDEHRAAIACESRPGEGTRFRVTFPRA